MKLRNMVAAAVLSASAVGSAQAVTLDIEFTNLTKGQSFTPRLLVAHDGSEDLFQVGETATRGLAWLAEAGVIDDFQDPASAGSNFQAELGGTAPSAPNALVQNPTNNWQRFGGLLPPSQTRTYVFDAGDFEFFTMASMLIPTNDAFVGLDSIRVPTEPGTYTFLLNAYDAGTELNDELGTGPDQTLVEAGTGLPLGGYAVPGVAGAPTSIVPVPTTGTGVAAQAINGEVIDGTDGPVHIHRNVLGDTDDAGGASDLDSRVHRWLNPVARLVITVPAQ